MKKQRYHIIDIKTDNNLTHVILKGPYTTMGNIIITVDSTYVWRVVDKRKNRGFRATKELKVGEVVKLPLF